MYTQQHSSIGGMEFVTISSSADAHACSASLSPVLAMARSKRETDLIMQILQQHPEAPTIGASASAFQRVRHIVNRFILFVEHIRPRRFPR
jgi:hypothetical protein